jgi:hypothetical protein
MLVLVFAGVVITVFATITIRSETVTTVDVNGIGSLVLDLHKVDAVLFVVIDGISDPFL